MFPTLISIGPIHISSFVVFLVFSFLVWSFVFWKKLTSEAIPEDAIYESMLWTGIVGLIAARLGFVITNWELFGKTPLRIFTIWIQGGYSFYAAMIGSVCILLFVSMKKRIHIPLVLDAFAKALGISYIIGTIGAMLGGQTVGTLTTMSFAAHFEGYAGLRYPVGLYEAVGVLFIVIALSVFEKAIFAKIQKHGMYAMWFFFLFSGFLFIVEYMKEHQVYFGGLALSQWILIGIFGQAFGALVVWGGGKGIIRKALYWSKVRIGGMYEKFSKRTTY